jgi:hypothetical protein
MNKAGVKEYTITRLTKDTLKDLAALHSRVYGLPLQEDYFCKKYYTAYTGVAYTGFLAYSKSGLPIAYYGVIPCFIQYGHEIILAAQSADTMTHPDHRYKGMFVELSNICFDLCKQLGIRLVFGFPNQNSYHGAINKLGWKMTGSLDCFSIPANSLPLRSLSRKLKLEKPYNSYVEFILKKKRSRLKDAANPVLDEGYAGVHRSRDYLLYKTYNRSSVISIGNSKVWISPRHNLQIGDMENVNETNFSFVIDQLKILAKKLGVTEIQFHCSPQTKLHKLFSQVCEPVASFPVLFQDFGSLVPLEKIRFSYADIDIF